MSTRLGRLRRTARPGLRPGLVTLLLSGLVTLGPTASLAQDTGQLDAFIAEAQREWPVPGLAVAIVKDGETVLEKGYGLREFGGADPVDAHTLFAIASNTKAFTAAALAILVEEGKMGWDDPCCASPIAKDHPGGPEIVGGRRLLGFGDHLGDGAV